MIREYSFRMFSERKTSIFTDAFFALQSCSARLRDVKNTSTELAVYPEFYFRRVAL